MKKQKKITNEQTEKSTLKRVFKKTKTFFSVKAKTLWDFFPFYRKKRAKKSVEEWIFFLIYLRAFASNFSIGCFFFHMKSREDRYSLYHRDNTNTSLILNQANLDLRFLLFS